MVVPVILDIEASGFGRGSYPIELGVALEDRSALSFLIKPMEHWTHWDASAEALHGISRERLVNQGRSPRGICVELNERLEGVTAYSDGWGFDSSWLSRLFYESNLQMTFRLEALPRILSESQLTRWDECRQQVMTEWGVGRHRAPTDARVLQETYVRTIQQSG